MSKDQHIQERNIGIDVVIGFIYIVLFILISIFASKKVEPLSSFSIWITSGLLYLILSQYWLKKFFETPKDIFANSFVIALAVFFDPNKDTLCWILFSYACLIAFLSFIAIITVKIEYKLKTYIYRIAIIFGDTKLLYASVFCLYTSLYLKDKTLLLLSLILYSDITWIYSLERLIYTLLGKVKQAKNILPKILGVANCFEKSDIFILDLELDKSEKFKDQICAIKIKNNLFKICLIASKLKINTRIRHILILTSLEISLKELRLDYFSNSILMPDNVVIKIPNVYQVKLASIIEDEKKKLQNCIGYIEENTNINTIKFVLFNEYHGEIKEGSIIYCRIKDDAKTLYQIINAEDKNDETGLLRVTAQKLGKYDEVSKQLIFVPWLPKLYEKVFLEKQETSNKKPSSKSIGILPETQYEILLNNIKHLVTYNTAILGILGIGKSCLAFELIQKIVYEGIKVICIDITDQYHSNDGLLCYISINDIEKDKEASIESIKQKSKDTNGNDVDNCELFSDNIRKEIECFLNSDKKVKIINPYNYRVISKHKTTNYTNEASIVEITRIITEITFNILNKNLSNEPKCLLVYEEAHSLIPEWNSVSNDSDKNHSNVISKIIMQGRKYGLGSLIITQRTANVSKSALSQCNTLFAMRLFDETSKDFLKNYIGETYTSLLPSIEERHAIVTGKGLDMKVPLMIKLNEKETVQISSIDPYDEENLSSKFNDFEDKLNSICNSIDLKEEDIS